MVSQWLLAASAYGGDGVDPRIRNQFRIGTDSQPPGSRRAVSIFWYMDRDRLISVLVVLTLAMTVGVCLMLWYS
jgi:hypothetical protein